MDRSAFGSPATALQPRHGRNWTGKTVRKADACSTEKRQKEEGSTMTDTVTKPVETLDAVVLGAGFAGLCMLHKLQNELA